MKRYIYSFLLALVVCVGFAPMPSTSLAAEVSVKELVEEIRAMKRAMKEQQETYEKKIEYLQKQISRLQTKEGDNADISDERALEEQIEGQKAQGQDKGFASSAVAAVQSMNPDISVIADTMYYNDSSRDGMPEIMENLIGFGHSHGGGGHEGHHHGSLDRGFNLREVELAFSAAVDPYFKGYSMVSFSDDGAEIEEAFIETTCLPWGFQLKGGKFFSNFGRINSQHPHSWDFVDKPLIYQTTMGYHGIDEKGVQLSWLAPLPFHLLLGVEALQGENEQMFNYIGGSELPSHDGPRLWLGWLKFSPGLPGKHGLQLGFGGGNGIDQEEHDGNSDGVADHWFDGSSWFFNADAVYKYDSGYQYGFGDLTVQGEYFYRKKDLEMVQNDLKSSLVGNYKVDRQDGYYLQTLYGFWPRWRAGLRWEQAGLVNKVDMPDGLSDDYGSSWRLAGMFDFSPTEFSLLRLQAQNGDYLVGDERENVWEIFLQVQVSLGSHGAHNW